jgi:hypothetical protein
MSDSADASPEDEQPLVLYAYSYAEGANPFLFLAREWEHGEATGFTPVRAYFCIHGRKPAGFDQDPTTNALAEMWSMQVDDLRNTERLAQLIEMGCVKRIGPMPELAPNPLTSLANSGQM